MCREVVDGGVGSCHAKSIEIVLHVNSDIPGLLFMSSLFNHKGDESGGGMFSQNSAGICLS